MRKKILQKLCQSLFVFGLIFLTVGTAKALPWVAKGTCSETTGTNPVVTCTGVTGPVEVRCEQYTSAQTLTLKVNGVTATINCGGICGSANGKSYCETGDFNSATALCNDAALEPDALAHGIRNTASAITEGAKGASPLWTWTCKIPNRTANCSAYLSNNCKAPICGTSVTKTFCSLSEVSASGTLCDVSASGKGLETPVVSALATDASKSKPFTWKCSAFGKTVDCAADLNPDCGEGCGNANGSTCNAGTLNASALCEDGVTTTPYLDGSVWRWGCDSDPSAVNCVAINGTNGTNGITTPSSLPGTTAPAGASFCGLANGRSFFSAPNNELCIEGTASTAVTEDTTLNLWKWNCKQGTDESCGCFALKSGGNLAIIGQSRSDTLSEFSDTKESSIGSVQFNEFSQMINRNIATLLQGLTDENEGTNDFVILSALAPIASNSRVYYVENRDLVIAQDTTFSNASPVTYIVNGGNLIVRGNTFYADNASVGFIVLNKDNAEKGNLYIEPNVTDVVGSFYAQGSLMSAEVGVDNLVSESEIYDGFSDTSALNNQLYLQGLLVSRNTIYGSTLDPSNANDIYDLPFGVIELNKTIKMPLEISQAVFKTNQDACHNETGICASLKAAAQRFDLEQVRHYKGVSGTRSVGVISLGNKISAELAAKAFIIRYDGKTVTATPPGFEN